VRPQLLLFLLLLLLLVCPQLLPCKEECHECLLLVLL